MRWNEFELNIRESFRGMRKDDHSFDVTLAADDGFQIQAHQIVYLWEFFSLVTYLGKLNIQVHSYT